MKVVGMSVYTHGTEELYLALEVEINGFNHMWQNRYRQVSKPRLATWLYQVREKDQKEKAQNDMVKRHQRLRKYKSAGS